MPCPYMEATKSSFRNNLYNPALRFGLRIEEDLEACWGVGG